MNRVAKSSRIIFCCCLKIKRVIESREKCDYTETMIGENNYKTKVGVVAMILTDKTSWALRLVQQYVIWSAHVILCRNRSLK